MGEQTTRAGHGFEHEVQAGKLAIYTRQVRRGSRNARIYREYDAYIERITNGAAIVQYKDEGGQLVRRYNVPLGKLTAVGDRL